MRYNLIILPFAILLTVMACGQEEKFEYTPTGYPFKFHINNEGASPKLGDYIQFRMYIRNEDSIVYSTTLNQVGTEEKKFLTAPFILHKDNLGRTTPQMDAMSVMSAGDSVTLYYSIADQARKPDNFENSDFMYYDIVLVDVLSSEEHNRNFAEQERQRVIARKAVRAREPEVQDLVRQTAAAYTKGELDDKVSTADSGLKYLILEEGEGKAIRTANYVKINYYGALMNGEGIASSFTIGDSEELLIGERKIIPGLEELFRYMKKSGRAIAFIPSELGYGDKSTGPIPPNSDLIYYVEMVDVR